MDAVIMSENTSPTIAQSNSHNSSQAKIRVGIIGCGMIAGEYAKDLKNYPELELVAVTDVDTERAQKFAETHGGEAVPTLDALLAKDNVDLVVDLATHHAHYEINSMALKAGKHLYSEKPVSLTAQEALSLVELAHQNGVRFGASPFTLMGEAQQTAWKLIREGKLGTVRVVYAEVNWGRIESWHPAPQPFYEVGPLFDVGVYPLSILTAMFGAAVRVSAFGKVVHPDRVTKRGEPFSISTPDFLTAGIEFASGVVARLTTDFYVNNSTTRQTGLEFHGDTGSLYMEAWHNFNSKLHYADFGKPLEEISLIREGLNGIPWSSGVRELALGILENRPHRFTGEHAAHITDILCAAAESAQKGCAVEIHSTFTSPDPYDWAQ
jgi:predicted dehydrogenase